MIVYLMDLFMDIFQTVKLLSLVVKSQRVSDWAQGAG